ncbi:MAG: MFS transporter, partial [Bacteroidota bacterium]
MADQTGFFGHPKGLSTLFFTEMWERFSYYGMKAILMLFMTTEVAQEGLGLENETAGAAYGLYAAGVYLLTLPGGWMADNILGQRKAIWYGGI